MTIAVTGANGLLGSTLCKSDPSIVPITRKDFDINDHNQTEEWFGNNYTKFSRLIHCAAVLGGTCDKYKELAFKTNVVATGFLGKLCSYYNISMFYISTDYCFNGEKGNYKETDFLDPLTYYAMTKCMGELPILAQGHRIIRTSFCGLEWPYDGAYIDKFSNRDTVDKIARLIKIIVGMDYYWKGILHVGTHRKSFYELAKRLKLDVKQLSIKDSKVKIPPDTSFDLTKMFNILDNIDHRISEEIRNERF